jgi:type IV pilus assembly protein PilC
MRIVFKAIDDKGTPYHSALQLESVSSLFERLERKRHHLLTYSHNWFSRIKTILYLSKIYPAQLRDLCTHVAVYDKANIPLLETLKDACETQENSYLKRVLEDIYDDLKHGNSLSTSLSFHTNVFDHFFIALIATAEQTGSYHQHFQKLAHYYAWQDKLKDKVKKALTYPIFIGILLIFLASFLMGFLVPQLFELMQHIPNADPDLTTMVHVMVDSFQIYLPCFVITMILIAISSWLAAKTSSRAHNFISYWMSKFPLVTQLQLNKYLYIFAQSFLSDIDVRKSLTMASSTCTNLHIKTQCMQVIAGVEQGLPLSESFEHSGLFPHSVIRFARIGEVSGNLGTLLSEQQKMIERKLMARFDQMVAVLQPCLILLFGALMAFMIVAIFYPLYETLNIMDM